MSGEFRMPSLGADMAAGKLVEWLKRPGDAVRRGDVVAVVETQKGAIEVEIFTSGTLERLLVAPGTTVPVGTPLALVREEGAPAEPAPRPPAAGKVSPAARRLATRAGIDLSALAGSGPGGAVVAADVEMAVALREKPAPAAARPGLDFDAMRQAIAAAMARSKREIPHYYLASDIDFGPARAWLSAVNRDRPPERRLLASALLVKAGALALRKFPDMNGFFSEGAFRPSAAIHAGFAVAIRGGGLIAPAIHDADGMGIDALMDALRDLVARVRAGTVRSSELADPTVTVTSLGERGADSAFPIIYPPQVAIVGFGRESLRPWVSGNVVAPCPVVTATLGADHRVSDGHRGGLLLAEIAQLLQHPETL
ncbi:MAG: dihydrolipoamide acetyltransferase family protein [Magnetospirillum sp.]|nr:dihydrolipoamide acetyltransferase family protein [Magnetospirillum sp.]